MLLLMLLTLILVLPLFQLGRLLLFPQFPLPQLLFPLFQLLLPLFQLLLPLPFQSGRFQLPPPPGRLPLSTTPGSV